MIESKFGEFWRSPWGILILIGLLMLAGIVVFLYVSRVFSGLIDYTPLPS